MTPEEKAQKEAQEQKDLLLKEIEADVKRLIDNSTKDSITKDELDKNVNSLNKKIEETLDNEGMKTLKDSVDKLISENAQNAAAIKAFTEKAEKATDKNPKTFREAFKNAILERKDLVLTEKNDDNGKRLSLKDYFTEKGNKVSPVFKAPVDMLESNIVQSEVANVRLTELDPTRVGIPLSVYPNVLDWMPTRSTSKPYISVLVAYSYEDGAGTKTEGSAPDQSSFLFKTVEFKAFVIGTYFTLSDETLDDLDEAMDEISMVGPDKIKDNVDSQILGSSGDDSTALAGILTATKNTAFVPGTYANQVVGANLIDVIAKMKLSCLSNKYKPDVVMLKPDDIDNMAALKDQMDNSIMDRRVKFDNFGNPVAIAGLRVMASDSITQDQAIVLDSKQVLIGKRREMEMKIGYNGTDLTEGQQTVVINVRVAFAVRDKAAIIYSNGLVAAKDVINKAP